MKNCDLDLKSITLKIVSASRECKYKTGEEFPLKDVLPLDECFFALHEVMPYYVTLKNGGYFKWEKDVNKVTTQCPNTDIAVALNVVRGEDNSISTEVTSVKSTECPKKYMKGNRILTSVIDNPHICITALDTLLPYILFLENCSQKQEKAEPIPVQCSFSERPTVFRLRLKEPINE